MVAPCVRRVRIVVVLEVVEMRLALLETRQFANKLVELHPPSCVDVADQTAEKPVLVFNVECGQGRVRVV